MRNKVAATKRIAKTKIVKAKEQNRQGGIGSSLIEQGVEQTKKSQNSIPENPGCKWDHQTLVKFYHDKLLPEIEGLESASKGARARCEDRGEDGSNGADDLFSNSKATNNAEILEKVRDEDIGYQNKKTVFLQMKEKIEAGVFICKCDYRTFYVKQIL